MNLDELLKGVEIIKRKGAVEDITGITDDSRKVRTGYLFAAIKGEKFDGHKFCSEAIQNGAKVLLVEKEIVEDFPLIVVPNTRKAFSRIVANYYGNPSRNLKVIGITGTNGKTTTAYLLSSLYPDSICFSTIKYFEKELEMEATNTTPPPLILHRGLHNAEKKGIKTAILEVSSIGNEQDRVSSVDFDYGVFLNITRDHLDYHKTFESYLDAKTRFFMSLGEDKIALVNVDDPNAPYLIKKLKSKVVTFGFEKGNIKGKLLKNTERGLEIRVQGMGKEIEIKSPLLGKYNASNILAAASLAIIDGLSDSWIIDHIQKAPIPPGRMEKIDVPANISVFVDYAHNPTALFAVISSFREFQPSRIITVFGAGGNRDQGKRSLMGMVSSNLSDIVIVTSDNPRNEDPERIIDNIFEGIEGGKVYRIKDRKEAISKALDIARKGDFVLIAGKGHEEYQEIDNKKILFSDKKCVKDYYGI